MIRLNFFISSVSVLFLLLLLVIHLILHVHCLFHIRVMFMLCAMDEIIKRCNF